MSSFLFSNCQAIEANPVACPFVALSTSSHRITPQLPPDRSANKRRSSPDTQRYCETPVDFLAIMRSAV